jgi:hypothetical protein
MLLGLDRLLPNLNQQPVALVDSIIVGRRCRRLCRLIVIVFGKHLRQNRPPLSINAARQQPIFVGPDAGHWGTHQGL